MTKENLNWDHIYAEFRDKNPELAKEIVDYRPHKQFVIYMYTQDGSIIEYSYLTKRFKFLRNVNYEEISWRIKFGLILDKKMHNAGYTKSAMCEMIGVSRPTLNRYLDYEATPSAYVIMKLADMFGCDVKDLIEF